MRPWECKQNVDKELTAVHIINRHPRKDISRLAITKPAIWTPKYGSGELSAHSSGGSDQVNPAHAAGNTSRSWAKIARTIGELRTADIPKIPQQESSASSAPTIILDNKLTSSEAAAKPKARPKRGEPTPPASSRDPTNGEWEQVQNSKKKARTQNEEESEGPAIYEETLRDHGRIKIQERQPSKRKEDQEPEPTYDGYAAVEDEEKNEGLSADSSSSTAKPKAVLVPRSDRTAWAFRWNLKSR